MISKGLYFSQFFRLIIKAFVAFGRTAPYNGRVRTRLVVTVLALAAVAAAVASAAEPRAVLERFLARVAATPLSDLTFEQDLTVFNPDGRVAAVTGTQRILVKLPDRQRVEQTLDGKTEVRVTTGGRTWRRGSDGAVTEVREGTSGITLAIPRQRSADAVLAEWRALGIREERFHESRMGGRTVTVVGAQSGERDRPAVWLDEEYGVMRFVAQEKGEIVLTDFVFSDHRPLTGSLFFPYRQEMFRAGKVLIRVIVRSVAVNTSPADSLFDRAALGAR